MFMKIISLLFISKNRKQENLTLFNVNNNYLSKCKFQFNKAYASERIIKNIILSLVCEPKKCDVFVVHTQLQKKC